MPWTVDDPPPPARNWTREEREKCVAAANAVLADGGDDEAAVFACIRAAGKGKDKNMTNRGDYEIKSFPITDTKVLDEEQGIVETVFTVFGVPDKGNPPDVSHPGAFAKTFMERGLKALVLDNHRTDSVLRVVGKPLAFREIGRDELPASILEEYPEATGGAKATIKFFIDTPEGLGVFRRLKNDGVREWSYGFDAITKDMESITWRGDELIVRNLRGVKLYEVSPTLWGLAESATLGAKSADQPDANEAAPAGDNSPLAVPMDVKDAVSKLIAALTEFQTSTVSSNDGEHSDNEAVSENADNEQGQETVVDVTEEAEPDDAPPTPQDGAGPDDAPLTSAEVDALLAEADTLLQEVNNELQRGTSGGARPD